MPKGLTRTIFFIAIIGVLAIPILADRTVFRLAWNLFTTQQDIEMGRSLADDAERSLPLLDQHNPNTYIDALGRQLIAHAPGARYPYQFKIVNDDTVNAWALPGGFIYVTSGMIQAAQNEPQLAGALAHQIGHVVLRHPTAQVSTAYAEQVPNANATRGRVSVSDAMNRLNIIFEPNAVPLKFTREQERQAFVVATQILYDANFDPQTMNQFFQRISSDHSNRTSDFFTAHPDLNNRAATVRTETRNIGPLPRNLRGDSPDFHSVKDRLASLDTNSWPGISDRNQSTANRPDVPSSRTILFSGRDMEFRYPENWRVSDFGDSITVSPDGGYVSSSLAYGMTIATYEPQNRGYSGRNSFSTQGSRTNTSTLSNATNELIDHLQQSNPNLRVVRNVGRRTVDGTQAMVVELTNDSPLGEIETDWLVIVLRPNGMLRYFVGVAPQGEFNRYQPAFNNIVTSVQFLD